MAIASDAKWRQLTRVVKRESSAGGRHRCPDDRLRIDVARQLERDRRVAVILQLRVDRLLRRGYSALRRRRRVGIPRRPGVVRRRQLEALEAAVLQLAEQQDARVERSLRGENWNLLLGC